MTDTTLTRHGLTQAVYSELSSQGGISVKDASTMVDAFFEEITRVLARHESVKLTSFGTFSLHHKKARVGRNPRTGKEAIITSRVTVSFIPSALFKQRVNKTMNAQNANTD